MMENDQKTAATLPDILADLHAAADAADAGEPLAPEVLRRIEVRADKVREQIRNRRGLLEISVDLIREARDSR